jgi:hypothetical protein
MVEPPARCLAVREEDLPSRVPFEQQRLFNIEEVEELLDAKWSGCWWTFDIKNAARLLGERGITYWPKYKSPHTFSSIRLRCARRTLTIVEVPSEHNELQAFCPRVSELTGFDVTYYGSSMAVVGDQVFRAFVTKRARCDRAAVAERQQGLCGHCQEELEDFEVHHIQAVSSGR